MNYLEKIEYLKNSKISYKDKVSKMTKLFTQEENVLWSIKCAESVLHIFEKGYPEDNRPRLAIEAAKSGDKNANAAAYAANAANAAAYAAAANAAAYAANTNAAAYAANAAAYAANTNAAAYAANAAAYAANAAAYAAAAYAANAAANEKIQEQKNIEFMIEVVERFKIFTELGT